MRRARARRRLRGRPARFHGRRRGGRVRDKSRGRTRGGQRASNRCFDRRRRRVAGGGVGAFSSAAAGGVGVGVGGVLPAAAAQIRLELPLDSLLAAGGRELLRLQTDRVRAAARLLQLGSVQPPPRSAPAVIDERLVVADAQDVRADAVRSRRLRDAGAVPARGGVRAVVVDERRRASRFARPGRSGRRRGGRRRHLRECRDFRSDVPRARRASLGGIKARPRGVASAWRSVLAPPPRAPRDEPRS
eukprot:31356-Pelagococcus_subviridis.AAC.3